MTPPQAFSLDDASYGGVGTVPQPQTASVFVKRLRALYPLSAEELTVAHQLVGSHQSLAGHVDIVRSGEPLTAATVLVRGLACRYRVTETARRQMTGFVVPGDICDLGFLSSRAATQGLLALGPVVVGSIDLAQLSAASEKHPNLMIAMMRAAALEQASAQELVVSLGVRDAVGRLAHLLCEMHYRLNVVGLVRPGNQFDLAMTQGEIGEALGLSTVHVNRTVQTLRRQNLIAMWQGVISIPDVERLAAVADFNAQYLAGGPKA
ncbi:Crp/Fnr family transcriptional regulator [uncultured Devosia sp.]|uniref:Crp/Fnr family transcriptional regulator n=1 Tax=uncultured Devosia sp. TaxID=211434 RepID=UPI0035CBB1E5